MCKGKLCAFTAAQALADCPGIGHGIGVAALDLCLTARAWIQSEDCLVALRMIQRRQADGVLQCAVVALRDLPAELLTSIEDAVLGEAYVAARRARVADVHREGKQPCACIRYLKQDRCVMPDLADEAWRWPEVAASDATSAARRELLQDLWCDYLRDLSEFEPARMTTL